MAAAVNQHGAMSGADQHGDLITPIAAMTQATMQQDHGRAGPIGSVPNSSAVMVHVAMTVRDRQGRGAMRVVGVSNVVPVEYVLAKLTVPTCGRRRERRFPKPVRRWVGKAKNAAWG